MGENRPRRQTDLYAHLMPRLGAGTAISPVSRMSSCWEQDKKSYAATKEKQGLTWVLDVQDSYG